MKTRVTFLRDSRIMMETVSFDQYECKYFDTIQMLLSYCRHFSIEPVVAECRVEH